MSRALRLFCVLLSPVALGAGAPPATTPEAALRHIQERQYGGRGADPIPLGPTDVRLRAVEVHLREVPVQDGWRVSAQYDLYNPKAVPAAVQLLLPEQGCPREGACSPMAGAFQDLAARLGEEIVSPVEAPAEAARPFAEPPGDGHLFRLTVPPKQARRLSLEYRFDRSRGAQFSGVHFLSSAGRWGGPVERVRYVVELAQPTPYVIYPQTYRLAEFAERPLERGAGSLTRLVLTAEWLAKRSDLLVVLPGDAVAGRTPAGPCEGFRGDLGEGELAAALRRYDKALLRACRDHVYALHGFPFKDPALRARYYGDPPGLPPWAASTGFAIAARPENRSFRESLLSPGEQAYLRALSETERRRGR